MRRRTLPRLGPAISGPSWNTVKWECKSRSSRELAARATNLSGPNPLPLSQARRGGRQSRPARNPPRDRCRLRRTQYLMVDLSRKYAHVQDHLHLSCVVSLHHLRRESLSAKAPPRISQRTSRPVLSADGQALQVLSKTDRPKTGRLKTAKEAFPQPRPRIATLSAADHPRLSTRVQCQR